MQSMRWCAIAVAAISCSRGFEVPPPPGPGSISARLVVALPGGDTQPAVGASVRLLNADVAAVSNADGRFVLTPILVAKGDILIQFDRQPDGNFGRQRFLRLEDLGAGPGRDLGLGDLLLRENATVRGRALRGDHADEASGHKGTTVFLPQGPFTTLTGDDGSWILANIPEGAVTLAFFRDGYQSASIDSVQVRAGESLAFRDVILQPSPVSAAKIAVSGTVRFSPAIADASVAHVSAVSFAGSTPFTVAADGTFSGTPPPGLYEMDYAAAGYTDAAVPNVLVAPGVSAVQLPQVTLSQGQAAPPDAGPLPPGPPPPDARISSATVGATSATFTLDASTSSGTPGHTLSFSWRQLAGQLVSIAPNDSPAAVRATVLAPALPQTLQFQLTVTDTVTSLAAVVSTSVQLFDPPVASITSPLQGRTGGSFQLDGSASHSANALSYAWLQTAGDIVQLSSATSARPGFVAPLTAQTLGFSLTVTDPVSHLAATALTQIALVNAPVATVTAPATALAGALVALDASLSSGPAGHALSWSWAQSLGDAVVLSANNSPLAAAVSFTAPATAQTLQFALTVTDASTGFTGMATVQLAILVLPPPVAAIASPGVGGTSQVFTLDGSTSTGTPGHALSFSWRQLAGQVVSIAPNDSPAAVQAAFLAPVSPQTLQFKLTVTDTVTGLTGVASASVQFFDPPIALITSPVQGKAGGSFQLNGSTSHSANAITYAWQQTSGSLITLSSATAAQPGFVAPLTAQTLGFSLTVTDTVSHLTATTTTQIAFFSAPAASASAPASVLAGVLVTLDGSLSSGPAGHVLSWSWRQGLGDSVVFSANDSPSASVVTFTAPATGQTLQFGLTVTDATTGLTGTTTAQVMVQVAPHAHLAAVPAQATGATVQLDATASTVQSGSALSFHWSATPALSFSANDGVSAGAPTFVAPSVAGSVTVKVTVTDVLALATDFAQVVVVVAVPPVAVISPSSLTVQAGTTFTLDGSGSGPPPITWSWTLSPASGANIANAAVAKPTLTAGTTAFTVTLVVSGPQLSSVPATLLVQINSGAAVNPALTLPANEIVGLLQTVTLTASATHPDPATTFAFAWTQTAGGAVSLLGASSASLQFVSSAAPDSLTFHCVVTATDSHATQTQASGSVVVGVQDQTAPHVIASDPPLGAVGGSGSGFYAKVVFDKDLNPATVNPANLYLSGGAGLVSSAVRYDGASRTATLLPDSPLTSGNSYTLNIGAVADLATPANLHLPETVTYTVRNPQWRLWSSQFNIAEPAPGITVTPTEVIVGGTASNPGLAAAFTWFLKPGTGADLAETHFYVSQPIGGCLIPTRRMHVAGAQAYAQLGLDGCGGQSSLFKRTASGWAAITGVVGGVLNVFSDGTLLRGASYSSGLQMQTYLPNTDSWAQELVEGSGYDGNVNSGVAGNGRPFASGAVISAGRHCLWLWERVSSVWTLLPYASGYANEMVTCASTPVVQRIVFAAGDPFVVYLTNHDNSGSPATGLQLEGARWNNTLKNWTLNWNDISAGAVVTNFDMVARGNTVFLIYAAGGQVYVKQLDLSGAGSFTAVPGPLGAASWNDNLGGTVPSCIADRPELFFADDALWATWQESCQANEWRIVTRRYSGTPSPAAPGSDPSTAGASCQALHTSYPSLPDGVYWVHANGLTFPAYCDMTTDDGGWTMAAVIYSDSAHFNNVNAVGLGGILVPNTPATRGARGKLSDATINALKAATGTAPGFRLGCYNGSISYSGYFPNQCVFNSTGDLVGGSPCTQMSSTYSSSGMTYQSNPSGVPSGLRGFADSSNYPNNRIIYGQPGGTPGCNDSTGWNGLGTLWVR